MRRGAKMTDGLVAANVADNAPAILSPHEPVHFMLQAIDRDAFLGLPCVGPHGAGAGDFSGSVLARS